MYSVFHGILTKIRLGVAYQVATRTWLEKD